MDALIDRLFSSAASRLVLETGQGAVLHTAGGTVALVRQPLSTEQIVQALAEIAPGRFDPEAPASAARSFAYVAPAGSVEVVVENRGGAIRAALHRQATTIPPPAAAPADGAAPPASGDPTPAASPSRAEPTATPTPSRAERARAAM